MEAQHLQQHEADTIRSDVVDLIARQRFLRLVEGGKFLKFSSKGQRIKDKFWLCKLAPNHKTLHYGDLDENRKPQLDELPNQINVSDLKRLIIGKDCPHTKDGHMKKTSVDMAFSLVYESDHEDYLNFVSIDQKTFCYWIDGLNALLKSNMVSEEFEKDLQMLTKIELKMRSME